MLIKKHAFLGTTLKSLLGLIQLFFTLDLKQDGTILWTQAEKETFTEFKLNYDLLVNEYLEGKEFSKPTFPELPKTLRVKVDKKSQLKKIQDLKNKLIN